MRITGTPQQVEEQTKILAKEKGISPSDLRKTMAAYGGVSSIHAEVPLTQFNKSCAPESVMVGDDGASIFRRAERTETADLIQSALKKIERKNKRMALILRLRNGIDCSHAHTLDEVGQILGVTRERVRQIEKKGQESLQKILEQTLKNPTAQTIT